MAGVSVGPPTEISDEQAAVGQACFVKDISWETEKGREKCCRDWSAGFEVAYWMCMSICVLCCKTLHITFECPDSGATDGGTPVDNVRDFPSTVPTDKGLSFTTSSYGAILPIVFGADKLPGNVIWASPIRRIPLNGGSEYYTVVDFALGICEGEINGLLRMWLGDKLILDRTMETNDDDIAQANTDGFISGALIDLTDAASPLRNLSAAQRQTKVSVFNGGEKQLPEGAIVTAEGYDNTPAYRGTAYMLLENFIVAESSIPAVSVEITSNTDSNFPRLYGTYGSPEVHFDSPTPSGALLVNPSYGVAYVPSRDSNGSATPADGRGYAQFNSSSFERETELEIDKALTIVPDYALSRLLPLTGFIMLHQASGNAGIMRTYNPFAGVVLDTMGPGGGVANHNFPTALSALGAGSIAFSTTGSRYGLPTACYMGVGQVNLSLGFLEIDENGQMAFVSNLHAVLPQDDARSAFLSIPSYFTEDQPTFVDLEPTPGHFIMMLSFNTGGSATTFSVCRVRVLSETGREMMSNPQFDIIDTISTQDIFGLGIITDVSLILIDPVDKCMVIFFVGSGTNGTMVVKYSPYTGEILWKSTAPEFVTSQGSDMAFISASSYAWMGRSTGRICKLNLTTGVVETLETSAGLQALPVPNSMNQYYHGIENSIIYTSNTADQRVVKVFLERLTRSTVELAEIVRLLLERVGVNKTQIDISDLAELTLIGYTISQKQSLRTCFSELGQAFKYDVIESNGRIKYKTRGEDPVASIEAKYFGDQNDFGWLEANDDNDISRIRKISMTYRDINREYRDNVQSIILPRYGSETFDHDSSIDVKVPIVLEADQAKRLAEILLYAKLIYDTTYKGKLPPRFMTLDPGDVVNVEPNADAADDFTIRLRKLTVGADQSVEFEASLEDKDIYTDVVNLFGNVGRYESSRFPAYVPRIDPFILNISFRSFEEAQTTASEYLMYVTFLNNRPNAAITADVGLTINGTDQYVIPKPNTFPTWGYVTEPPNYVTSRYSTDYVSQLRVRLMSSTGAAIASTTHANLLSSNSYNLAYVGGELLQFETAVNEGNNIWCFTNLHRAKMGTDVLTGIQVPGDKFILLGDNTGTLDDNSIRVINVAVDSPKMVAQIFMRTNNPLQPATPAFFIATNLRCFTVNDFSAAYSGNDVNISWQRRTRYDGEWIDDGSDQVPVNEIDETYVLYLYIGNADFDPNDPDTYLRRVELTTNSYQYTLAMQTADGFVNTVDNLYPFVYQQGSAEGFRTGATKQIRLDHK